MALDSSGDLFIAETGYNVIREVNHATGVISTVAGDGQQGYSGDGGPATAAALYTPTGVHRGGGGLLDRLYIGADKNNSVIFARSTSSMAMITTIAGSHNHDYIGDGGSATAAALWGPGDVIVDGPGDLFIADTFNNRIREVNHATGVIMTVAGDGHQGVQRRRRAGDRRRTERSQRRGGGRVRAPLYRRFL